MTGCAGRPRRGRVTEVDRPEDAGLRWGFVGTGTIARWMAEVVRATPGAELTAVASRRLHTANEFARMHGASRVFDSWSDMLDWEGVDAVYVATPTSLREEICIGAARAGKHVLAEKPFASLPSLRRITAACRGQRVGFMDATHFVHHPRHTAIRNTMEQLVGRPRSLQSSFLVSLTDRSNIRYQPALEPLGALGDLGWYNMRATIEYLAPSDDLQSVTVRLHRDGESGAITGGAGTLRFADGRESAWRCAFDAAALDIGLELEGSSGTLRMENFVGDNEDRSAGYHRHAADAPAAQETVRIESEFSGPALMFRDFATMARDPAARGRWISASESTQALLDAVLEATGR